jgi:predicted XRE-type DNA-binding protein
MPKMTTNAVKILGRIAGPGEEMKKLIENERANLEVARQIFSLRNKAKLSQKQLAMRLGTTQSAVSRLEDADYDGHSLTMLQRVAAALDKRVEIRFVPAGRRNLQPA